MIRAIAKVDGWNLRADRTLWMIGFVLTATILYGVHNGAEWVRFQSSTIHTAIAEERDRLDGLARSIADIDAGRVNFPSWKDPRNPFAVGNGLGAHWAVMPPAPLAALAIGQSDLLPYYYKVSLRSRDTLLGNDEIENPVHLLSGRFDLAFVVIYLYPLLILALSYNLISSEKEDGTLAMSLSQPVSLRTLVLGKIAFRGSFVLLAAVCASLLSALVGGVNFNAEGVVPRLLLWVAVVGAYGAFWFALAVAINAMGRGSAANALTLACAWLALVLLVPSLLNVAIKATYPVPSRVELIQAMRLASDEVTAERSRLMARYLEDHPELTGASSGTTAELAIRNVAMMEETERRVEPVLRRFDEQLASQQSLADRFRYVSPTILTQSALYDLAGTGANRHKHFVQAVQAFHRSWRNHFTPLMVGSARLSVASLQQLPRFAFQEESTALVVERATGALFALLGLTPAVSSVAVLMLKRYALAS